MEDVPQTGIGPLYTFFRWCISRGEKAAIVHKMTWNKLACGPLVREVWQHVLYSLFAARQQHGAIYFEGIAHLVTFS